MDNSLDRLKEFCQQIGKEIALEIDRTNGDEVAGKLQTLSNLLATSSHACALSKQVYSAKIMELTLDNAYVKLSATDRKNIFAGRAKNEGYYVDLCEEQNKSLKYSIEALRSMLSYLKVEMERLPTN
ncbi:MAG: Uncharacterized protein JWQ66_2925 [Mucilaginibacter sp.]|nr:Uncharacterized protein [Mucilaginibacter sp.]